MREGKLAVPVITLAVISMTVPFIFIDMVIYH